MSGKKGLGIDNIQPSLTQTMWTLTNAHILVLCTSASAMHKELGDSKTTYIGTLPLY